MSLPQLSALVLYSIFFHVFIDQYISDVTVLEKKLLSNYVRFEELLNIFSGGVKRDHAMPLQHGPIISLHPRYGKIPVWTAEHNPQKLIIQEASTEMTDNTKKRGRG